MRFVYFWFLKTGEKKRSKITMEKKIQLWHQWNHHTLQFMCYCVHLDQQSVDQRRCHVVDDTVGRNWKKRWFNYLSQFNGFTTYQKIKSKYLKRKRASAIAYMEITVDWHFYSSSLLQTCAIVIASFSSILKHPNNSLLTLYVFWHFYHTLYYCFIIYFFFLKFSVLLFF